MEESRMKMAKVLVAALLESRRRFPRVALLALLALGATLAAPSFSSAEVTSHGGPVQTKPEVFEIFWGPYWTENSTGIAERSKLEAFYNDLNGSTGAGWQGTLTQYWGPLEPENPTEATPFGFVSSSVTIGTPYAEKNAPPAGITNANMEAEIGAAVKAMEGKGGWPKELTKTTVNAQFVIFTPPGVTWGGEINKGACGEHSFHTGTYAWARVTSEFEKSGQKFPCSLTVTAAHEYAETASDPYLEAWRNWTNGEEEIADLCALSERTTWPGGIEVPRLWDNYRQEPFQDCTLSHLNPPQEPPKISTEAATAITSAHATLHGSAELNKLKIENFWFQWGLGTSYGHVTTSEPGGNIKFGANATITNLDPNTTYHYRLVLQDAGSFPQREQTGKDMTFKTPFAPPVVTTEAATGVGAAGATLRGTVNPKGLSTNYQFEYDTKEYKEGEGAHGTSVPVPAASAGSGESNVSVSKAISGLALGTTYHFRIVASNECEAGKTCVSYGKDLTFRTLNLPMAITEAATNTQTLEPQLNGTLNPEGADTHYQFEYDTKEYKEGEGAHGTSVPVPAVDAGSEVKAQTVSFILKGVKQNTTYHFRIVAENEIGITRGADRSFTTIGTTATTEAATAVVVTEATLKGAVNPAGVSTSYQFEYGKTTSYGQVAPLEPKGIGSGLSTVKVQQTIASLEPKATYHFRIVATNAEGTVYGADQVFTTNPGVYWLACTKQAGGRYTSSTCATEGAPNEWESLHLKEGEKVNITAKGNPIAFTSTQSGLVTTFSCETEAAGPSLENPSGGGSGVGAAEVKYKGCKPEGIAAEKGCKVENTANFASKLEVVSTEGKTQVVLKPSSGEVFAKFSVSSCSIGALNGTYELKGTMRGLYSNANSKIEFTTESTGESSLTLRGQKATAVGSIGLETSGGGRIKAEPEVHWYGCTKQAGGRYTSSTCATEGAPNEWESLLLKAGEKTTIVAKGNPIAFTSTQSGLKTTFSCETEVAGPSLENPSGGGSGVGAAEVKYKGCKPEGIAAEKGCKVENTANFASKLEVVLIEGKTQVVFLKPSSGEVFAKFSVSSCSIGALNGTYELKGTMRGLYSNANSKIEFTTESTGESSLTLRGQKATAVGSIGLETSGGGTIRAE
jgi:hypothetical protein